LGKRFEARIIRSKKPSKPFPKLDERPFNAGAMGKRSNYLLLTHMHTEELRTYEHWRLVIFREKFALQKSDGQLIALMNQHGISEPKAKAFIQQASAEYEQAKKSGTFKRTIRKKFLIYGIVLAALAIFPALLSYYVLKGLNPGLTMAIAAAMTFCVIRMVADYRTPNGYDSQNDPFCIEPHRYSFKLLLLWIPLFFALMSVENWKHSNAIQNEVVLTTGIIQSGRGQAWIQNFSQRNFYSVSVKLPNGKTQTVDLLPDNKHNLFKAYIGQEVIIAWHDDEPTLRKILYPADTIKYLGVRTISFRNYMDSIDFHIQMDRLQIQSSPDRIETLDPHY
jgi:hypothetical protein